MSEKQLVVGIADMKIGRGPSKLITYALGSCIGICFYDPMIRLGGMVHIMLPNNMEGSNSNVFKYADTGIPAIFRQFLMKDAAKSICALPYNYFLSPNLSISVRYLSISVFFRYASSPLLCPTILRRPLLE